jgi:hypothetical protein
MKRRRVKLGKAGENLAEELAAVLTVDRISAIRAAMNVEDLKVAVETATTMVLIALGLC